MAGGAAAAHIACWNGVSWAPLGKGVNGSARVMKVWDDGSGPALFVGGDFDLAGGAPANFIAKWNGAWSALQSGLGNFPASMEAFDDGDGERLYVSGPFFSAGSASAQIIATWDGTTWAALPVEPNRPAQSLRVFNDGSGEALYAGGPFTEFGGALISGVVRWNGVSWTPLGTGVTQGGDLPSVTTLCVFDADGPGPAPAGLFAGGVFDGAGALHVQNLAVWRGSSGGPVFTNQPGSTLRYTGQAITLSAAATGQGALGYQWRKNGQLLTDGGRISGAMTNALVISPAVLSDAAEYDVVAMDDCGTLTSSGATVTVICYANCDHSTGIPPLTSNDFQCFLNRFAAGDSYANCDGSTGTPALTSNDFQCFLNSFAAGCP